MSEENPTTRDLVRMLISSQMESARREAAREEEYSRRQSALEEVVLKLSETTIASKRSPSVDARPPGIDLSRFRTSDGPVFNGPYHDVEAFLRWFVSLKAFFRTKGVVLDSDKITLVGNFITEPNTQAFYEADFPNFIIGTWDDFIPRLFAEALPSNWEDKLYQRAQHLRMTPYEEFKAYSTRARSIQNLVNFNTIKLSDHQLAKFVEYGMIEELKTAVDLWDLTADTADFKYQTFEQRCIKLYDSMVASKQIIRRSKNAPGAAPAPSAPRLISTPRLSDEEFVWKIHSYLDSIGKCHFCKGYCGSAHRECKGPYVKEKVVFPPGYTAPPKPSPYIPPRARSSPPGPQAGRPTQAPAGRPPTSKVAAVTELPDLEEAAVAALEDLDAELAEAEGCVPTPPQSSARDH